MKFTLDQRSAVDEILEGVLRDNGGYLSDVLLAERIEAFLEREHDEGRLAELIPDLAHRLAKQTIKGRSWEANGVQQALYDAEALLALGDSEHVRMADAEAEHLVRHRAVLDENFRQVTDAYNAKNVYLNDRIPRLWAVGGRLGDLEES